ncbi:protein E4 [Pigeon adenovirus 2]|uniref:Protein E4 n=1 Tax=Pigeon adenovirus 2 TaxID=1907767 RepID=A0A1D8QMB3_9ADEN|nr:protein E4 [Pigeon adenovirus 2]AOW42074.1 protein E4 [Pigeon adenovirus 2]
MVVAASRRGKIYMMSSETPCDSYHTVGCCSQFLVSLDSVLECLPGQYAIFFRSSYCALPVSGCFLHCHCSSPHGLECRARSTVFRLVCSVRLRSKPVPLMLSSWDTYLRVFRYGEWTYVLCSEYYAASVESCLSPWHHHRKHWEFHVCFFSREGLRFRGLSVLHSLFGLEDAFQNRGFDVPADRFMEASILDEPKNIAGVLRLLRVSPESVLVSSIPTPRLSPRGAWIFSFPTESGVRRKYTLSFSEVCAAMDADWDPRLRDTVRHYF